MKDDVKIILKALVAIIITFIVAPAFIWWVVNLTDTGLFVWIISATVGVVLGLLSS